MEIQFKNILKKSKAIESGTDPIGKTFEGALFQDSSWYLALQDFKVSAAVIPETRTLVNNLESAQERTQDSLCDVLFLGDTFNGSGEDLLHKMIVAMHLGQDKVVRVPFDESVDTRQELLGSISINRPKVVVSLGAIVTNILLEKKEKLSSIHGQLIPEETSHWKYLMMPLFHPEFLLINPNMKRTAWNDLQKIMELLKKES